MTAPSIPFDFRAAQFSPAPLLDAFENFHGAFFDLDRDLRISASELKKIKTELRRQMIGSGLRPGDRIIAALPNGPLFAAVWAASLEAEVSPILVHGETPKPELERMAQRWGGQFLVTEAGTNDSSEQQPGHWLAGEHGTLRWRRVASQASTSDQLRLASVPLHPTSGTSGEAKLAVRPGPCAVAEPLHYIETLGIERSDAILCAIPMSHAYAYGMCFMVALLTSANLLFMRRYNPELVCGAVNEMGVSVLPAVPVMLDSLLPNNAVGLTGRPRIVLSAGAPLARKTFEAFRDRYQLCVRPLYGTTETGGISISPTGDEFDGSVGPPIKGVEVDLRGREAELGAETGVLRVRSSSMMAGYLEGNGVSRFALCDGWFETGDLARIDAQGRIHLQGRVSEAINAFGFKVIPWEVEEVIAMLPEVMEVKVYAGRHSGADTVEAAVVCHHGLSEEQILKHCEKHLVSYKCPTAIRFVDSLPRTASGKVALERLSSEMSVE
jgi:long-chain acyl-CoA synthetase